MSGVAAALREGVAEGLKRVEIEPRSTVQNSGSGEQVQAASCRTAPTHEPLHFPGARAPEGLGISRHWDRSRLCAAMCRVNTQSMEWQSP
jgi:hypothetical protein